MGVTKVRITQIRTSAPARARAFFGVGPVSIGIPLRYGSPTGSARSSRPRTPGPPTRR